MISRMACACGSSRGHSSSASNMRREASVTAEARPSNAASALPPGSPASISTTLSGVRTAGSRQRQRRGEPAQAPADDRDV
jgi:hypothetical protein